MPKREFKKQPKRELKSETRTAIDLLTKKTLMLPIKQECRKQLKRTLSRNLNQREEVLLDEVVANHVGSFSVDEIRNLNIPAIRIGIIREFIRRVHATDIRGNTG